MFQKLMLPLFPIIHPSIISHLTSRIFIFLSISGTRNPPIRYKLYTLYTEARLSHFSQPFSPTFHSFTSFHNPYYYLTSFLYNYLLLYRNVSKKEPQVSSISKDNEFIQKSREVSNVQKVSTQDSAIPYI